MRAKLFVLFFILFFNEAFAKNILIVGDSHSVGPFGHTLFSLVKKTQNQVAIFAHSSSASYHWMSSSPFKLSGGAYHAMKTSRGVEKTFPFPADWRVKISTISFDDLTEDMFYHSEWLLQSKTRPNIVVVALGANDYNQVTTESGGFNQTGYKIRQNSIHEMLTSIEKSGAECLWVLPPDGIKKESKRQKLLYEFLEKSIQNRCTLFNSSKYKSTGCDGIHFSCSSQASKARAWASEVMESLNKLL